VCCGVLLCVAVCCSVLQGVAVCCGAYQNICYVYVCAGVCVRKGFKGFGGGCVYNMRRACTLIGIHAYIYTRVYIHITRIYTYIHINVFICVCTHIYAY